MQAHTRTSFPDLIRFLVWGYGDHEIILLINLRNNSISEGHILNLMNAKNLIDTNRYITQMYDYAYRKYVIIIHHSIVLEHYDVCPLDVSSVAAAGPNNVRVPRRCSVLFKFLGTKFKCQVASYHSDTNHAYRL